MQKSRLQVEVARSEHTRQAGLMHRKYLAENAGMLFCFGSEGHYSFWMQNTYIPLDIAFLDVYGKVLEIKEMYPLSTRSVRSSHKCKYALEVNRGWFGQNGVKAGSVLFPSKTKKASGDEQAVRLVRDFKGAVDFAVEKGWNIIITYRPKGKPQKYKTPYKIDPYGVQNQENSNFVKDYELILSDGVENLAGQTSAFTFATGKGGDEYITARIVQESGEPRSFTLKLIDQYAFRRRDGKVIQPEDLKAEDFEPVYEDVPDMEEKPPVEEKKKELEFEEDRGDMGETITFWDKGIPAREEIVEDVRPKTKAPKTVVKPKPEPKPVDKKQKRPWWEGYKDMWGLLRKNEETHKEFMRQAQGGGGESGEGNMMTQYWKELKKKRGQGLTEGEAILQYLKENEDRQKQSRD